MINIEKIIFFEFKFFSKYHNNYDKNAIFDIKVLSNL